jgi:lipopolysaccharide export system protein LptA
VNLPLPSHGRPRRFRRARIVLAGLLLACAAVLLGTYLYEHHRNRNEVRPVARVPFDISRTASGFMLSKSEGGRMLFRIQANTASELKADNFAVLKGVRIDIYDPHGTEADRISGQEFAYNVATGEVTARGNVAIDVNMSSDVPAGATATGVTLPAASPGAVPLHLEATGLAFNTKSGVGDVTGGLKMQYPNAQGSAGRAHFDDRTNVLFLSGGVGLDWMRAAGAPVRLTGSTALLDRDRNTITVSPALIESPPPPASAMQRLQADTLTVFLRDDYSPQRAIAKGNVRATSLSQTGTVTGVSDRAEAIFREPPANAPAAGRAGAAELASLTMVGNTNLQQNTLDRRSGLAAGSLLMEFAARNRLTAAHARDGARLQLQRLSPGLPPAEVARRGRSLHQAPAPPPVPRRMNPSLAGLPTFSGAGKDILRAPGLDFAFAPAAAAPRKGVSPGGGGAGDEAFGANVRLASVTSVGHAHLESLQPLQPPAEADADALTIVMSAAQRPQSAAADGNVKARQAGSGTTPARGTSADHLRLEFDPAGALARATESGDVDLHEAAPAGMRTARADGLHYTAAGDTIALTASAASPFTGGVVMLDDPQMRYQGPVADVNRTTGVITGHGGVRLSLLPQRLSQQTGQTGSAQEPARPSTTALAQAADGHSGLNTPPLPFYGGNAPVNVTADSMQVNEKTGAGEFTGRVRVWQGENTTMAQRLQFDRSVGALTAQGDVVSAFVQRQFPKPPAAAPSRPQGGKPGSSAPGNPNSGLQHSRGRNPLAETLSAENDGGPIPVTITADSFAYSEPRHHARYSGNVVLSANGARLTTTTLDVDLATTSAQPIGAAKPANGPGAITRAIASGGVQIVAPGRRAEAKSALYDFTNDLITLSGGPPSIYDAERGFLTGHALTFSPSGGTIRVESEPGTRIFSEYQPPARP